MPAYQDLNAVACFTYLRGHEIRNILILCVYVYCVRVCMEVLLVQSQS